MNPTFVSNTSLAPVKDIQIQGVKGSLYLENIEDFGIVNVIFSETFGEHKPARTTIAVKALPKNSMIMVDVIALSEYSE